MEATCKEEVNALERNEYLCVSPRVIEKIAPEEVSVAVIRHLGGRTAERLSVYEKGSTDRAFLREGEGLRSVHQSTEGLKFYVTSDFQDFFINVTLPGER